jgi:hypothetical protein
VIGVGTKRLSECFRAGERLELLERLERLEQAPLVKRWNHWNRLLSGVFNAMEGLTPQVKRKILSDNPRRFYGDLKHHSLEVADQIFEFATYWSSQHCLR